MTSEKVKVGVVGTDSLGKEHVRLYAEMAAAGRINFAGVYDVIGETAQKLAAKYKLRAFGSVEELAAAADALSIVTPTSSHFDLSKDLLGKRKHLLVEK